jgi:hypothetical protein
VPHFSPILGEVGISRRSYCTVSTVDPVIPPEFAPMVVVPAFVQVASAATLGALAMVATLAEEELQCAFSVTSCVLPSLKVPVAVNCFVVPAAAVGATGVIARDTSVPVRTVNVVVPLMPEAVAVTVTEPPFFPCAIPLPRTLAMFGFEDFHDTPLRFVATLPSLNVPVAVSLTEVPLAINGFAGTIEIETRCAVETVKPVDPLTAP